MHTTFKHLSTSRVPKKKENLVDESVLGESPGETHRMNIETLPVLLMNYQWSRKQKWYRARVSMVFILTS